MFLLEALDKLLCFGIFGKFELGLIISNKSKGDRILRFVYLKVASFFKIFPRIKAMSTISLAQGAEFLVMEIGWGLYFISESVRISFAYNQITLYTKNKEKFKNFGQISF